jgi:hypothetical protein
MQWEFFAMLHAVWAFSSAGQQEVQSCDQRSIDRPLIKEPKVIEA